MDINGGFFPNLNGSPVFPSTTFTGPLVAGNVIRSNGSGTLAGVGETSGIANAGYTVMAQTAIVTQTSAAGTVIVIPAQSQILSMTLMVTTIWNGASPDLGIGNTASATAYTAASAVTGAGVLGQLAIVPGTGATQIANWDNVGSTDVQIIVTSANTGTGVGTLTVTYLQGINNAS
jgi:hypothetical protein